MTVREPHGSAQSVELETAEWQQVISALAMTNPLLVKISSQLASQQARADAGLSTAEDVKGILRRDGPGNSKEPHHGL